MFRANLKSKLFLKSDAFSPQNGGRGVKLILALPVFSPRGLFINFTNKRETNFPLKSRK